MNYIINNFDDEIRDEIEAVFRKELETSLILNLEKCIWWQITWTVIRVHWLPILQIVTGSVWSKYSMVKNMLSFNDGIDTYVTGFSQLFSFQNGKNAMRKFKRIQSFQQGNNRYF